MAVTNALNYKSEAHCSKDRVCLFVFVPLKKNFFNRGPVQKEPNTRKVKKNPIY